jgi:hypothetical protein
LQALTVSDYPHLKGDDRKKIFQALQKQAQAYQDKKTTSKALSNEELFKMIAGR